MSVRNVRATPGLSTGIDDRLQLSSVDADSARGIAPNTRAPKGAATPGAGCSPAGGMPDVRCGDRVRVGEACGTIVGHNASANFDVLFDEGGKYSGLTLNVHPSEIERVPA